MSEPWPSTLRLVRVQIAYQNLLFRRTPVAAFFVIILPLGMLVLLSAVLDDTVSSPDGEIPAALFYAPSLACFSVASATYTNLGIGLPIYRDDGVLKKVRSTPLPPWIFIAGAIGSAMWIAAISATIMMGVGAVFYDVGIEAANIPAAVVAFLVGAAAFAALGVALAALVPNANSAAAMANATLLPIAFVSNVFVPAEDPPAWVEAVGKFFPLSHFVAAFSEPFRPWAEAPAFEWQHNAYVALWGIAGAIVAVKFFRWEPPTGKGSSGRRSRVRTRSG